MIKKLIRLDFDSLLYEFISKLPYSVDEDDTVLKWKDGAVNNFNPTESICPQTYQILTDFGIEINRTYYNEIPYGRYFLYKNIDDILVGDGWISFSGYGLQLLYKHWGDSAEVLIDLFQQFIDEKEKECLFEGVDSFDKETIITRFETLSVDADYPKRLTSIDKYLEKFQKNYIIPTHISKTNFLKFCKDASWLKFGATQNGELVWDILTFVKNNIELQYFDNLWCYDAKNDDRHIKNHLYNALCFESVTFGDLAKHEIEQATLKITKDAIKRKYVKLDDDLQVLKKSIMSLLDDNQNRLWETKEFQSRYFPQYISEFKRGSRLLSFNEDASHCSDDDYGKYGYSHRSYIIVNERFIKLIPSDKKYREYLFDIREGREEIALALIVGYFKSLINNKRQRFLIEPLFNDFGIYKVNRL